MTEPEADRIQELEQWVDQMAHLIDLPLHPEHRPGVVENMARLQTVAQLVMGFSLPEEIEIATIFRP